jgi:tetratricopeptide (TPR) repeat protein/tRNA A-37 threonylcarbamoyl transferase component Bud32
MTERELFIEALERSDPAERWAFLEQACAGDESLHRRVEELLEAHFEASEVLKGTVPPDAETSELTPPPPTDGTKLVSTSQLPSTATHHGKPSSASDGKTKMLSTDEESAFEGLFLDVSGMTQFEILAELGRGGMGVVYKARHRQLNRIVALKMIGDGKHASREVRERFLIEAEAVARFRHPNIVQIYDIGEADGRPYVTLEMLEGGSLADRLKGTTQPGRDAAELLATLAMAMHAAHQAGIVHRDLKPPNVLFDHDGTPKITDFGLAKRLEVEEGQTQTGQIMGTPSYMAPEQARGDVDTVGPPADIYALGAILYEMLTGRPPFKGSSMMETLHQVVFDDVVPPSRIQPRIARDLETICLKCLEKEPQERYTSATDLAEDLRRYLDDVPIRARRTPLWERGWKWVRRHPTTTTLIGLGTAAALALVIGMVRADANRRAADRAEDQRVADVTKRSEQLLDAFQSQLLVRDWGDGRLIRNLTDLVAGLKKESRLVGLRGRAEHMLESAERGARDEADGRRDREWQRQFIEHRDAAFFSATRYTGADLPTDAQKTRAAARLALATFANPDVPDRWTFGPPPRTLPPQEQAEIVDGCYQLLLVLAEAVTETLPGEDPVLQAERGLKILDQASALRAEPTPTYHRLRAVCLEGKRDGDGAKREQEAANRVQPTTVLDHFLVGHDAYKRRDWKTALEEFDTTLRMQPGHFWALCESAITSFQINQPSVAKPSLNGCIEQRRDYPWLFVLRGFASGLMAVQARAAGKTLGFTDESIEAGVEAQFKAGEDDFREALRLLASSPNDELRYAVLNDRALIRFQLGRLDDSVADFREAIRVDTRHYNAFASLAQILQRQNHWDEAVAQFTQAIALEPQMAALYRGRAAVLEERDDQTKEHRADALRDLDEAIRREGPGKLVLAGDQRERGELLRRDGRFEEALAACDEALKIAPDFNAAHRLRVWVLLDLNRADEVIRSCDGALARGKPWPDIYEIRGLARFRRANYAGAIDDYSHALVLRPGQSRVLYSRGMAYIFSDAPRLALHDFDEALRIDSSNGEAHSGRGQALVLLGDSQGAIAEAEESLRSDPPTARRAYNAARVYAQAAVAASGDITEKGRLAIVQVDRFQQRAVALVKLALERTPAERRAAFWKDDVAADPALRTLQRRLRGLQP